jgi:DNA gyrase inhibitor GyrI
MVVDFVVLKAPGYRLATKTLRGRWPGDKRLRGEFESVSEWAKTKGLRTGKWVFRELEGSDTPETEMRWEVGVEIRSREPVRGGKGISMKTLLPCVVASATFDPDQVSSRLVYHGLSDWLRWREKSGEYKEAGPYREVYVGNPWAKKSAWAHTQVQVPLKKLS